MNERFEDFKGKVHSAFRSLAKESAAFEDAEMLVGSADTNISLLQSKILKNIDTEWIEKIEAAIPAIDAVVRAPSVAIEDVDEILPVELSRHITEKSIKHLAQHTNLILDIKDDEITPSKILNVFHEETYLTYENKFVNTLLARLSAFVDKRFAVLNGGSGAEHSYKFDYNTEFDHLAEDGGSRSSARINLRIELTSPLGTEVSDADIDQNEKYSAALERIKKINMALIAYRSSAFATKLGRNYVRPPVIRTNAILKNKNLRECLNLWEYIENYDKAGYAFLGDKYTEMPSSDYIGGLYSSIALQYVSFYSGVVENWQNNRLITNKHIFETMPEFNDDADIFDVDDYVVYDTEYKKTVPVSRLASTRKQLSEDEKNMREAILLALKADEIIHAEELKRLEEERRLERERILREEEERRREAEEARLREEAERERIRKEAEEERLRREAEEERIRKEAEEERLRREAEEERIRKEAEEERLRREAEEERIRKEAEEERLRREAEEERIRKEAEEERLRREAEEERIRKKAEEERLRREFEERRRQNLERAEKPEFIFSDSEDNVSAVVIPYTRAQYLSLPRKKKKSILTDVRKLIEYSNTKALLEEIRKENPNIPRHRERMERLEEELCICESALPTAKLWENSVNRLKK